MMHETIESLLAPKAIGPYSQAVVAKGQEMVFISGQIPLNAQTMKIEGSDARSQTKVVLTNLRAILEAAHLKLNHVVKTTLYIKNMDDFAVINEVYAEFFGDHRPARACVEVARLPRDVLIEIDAVAAK